MNTSSRNRWGDRMRGGAVTGGTRGREVWVNASVLGTGVTARISPDDAEEFAAQLLVWVKEARRGGVQ